MAESKTMKTRLVGLARKSWEKVAKSEFVEFTVRGQILPFRIRHLYGPQSIDYGEDELVAVCVVRNGALFIDAFFEHHEAIGIKHFVFLDNQSTDKTVEMLRLRKNVTILQTGARYANFENSMKRFLVNRYCKGRWSLCVDMDEHFNFPYSDSIPLRDFLRYLNRHQYTGVVTQMLDMFSDVPLSSAGGATGASLQSVYNRYDVSSIEKLPYRHQHIENDSIKKHFGGIRKTIFGTNNGLTKISLLRVDGKVEPFIQWHHTRGAKIADISCVLFHYPFVEFAAKVSEAVTSNRYGIFSVTEYGSYAKVLQAHPDLRIKTPGTRTLSRLDDLISCDFLVVSDAYKAWAEARGGTGRVHSREAAV